MFFNSLMYTRDFGQLTLQLNITYVYFSGNFLCKSCGETIASGKQLHHYASLNSLKLWNQTLLGIKNIPIQVFQNPNGNKFNVLTFSKCNAHSLEEVMLHSYN